MHYIEESLKTLRQIGLKGAGSPLESLLNLGKGELFVLNYLYFRNKAMNPSELSKALGSTTARVSAILKVLEKKQEITREVDSNNRNHVWVTLTNVGRNRAENITKALDKTMTAVFQEMGEQDTVAFLRLTNRFLDTLQKYPIDV